MAATDLEVGVRLRVIGTVHETGAITVPARKLAELVRQLPAGEIHLEVAPNHQVELLCGRSQYRLFGLPAEEFPAVSAIGDDSFTIEASLLRTMIERTRFAASTEETRYFLNGVYFHLSPKWVRMVATDSRRLAMMTHPAEGLIKKETGVIIPIKAVHEIARAFAKDEDIRIALRDNREIVFATEQATLTSRLVDAEYPEYERYIPSENPIHVTVEREALFAAIGRVNLFANPKTSSVSLDVKENLLTLSASSQEFGEAKEELDVTSSEGIRVGFNANFLMDVVRVMDSENVRFELRDPVSAALIRPEGQDDYVCLIMPQRLE